MHLHACQATIRPLCVRIDWEATGDPTAWANNDHWGWWFNLKDGGNQVQEETWPVANLEKELKQVYMIYYVQCDKGIKPSIAEDAAFKWANEQKDFIQLYKILQSTNFSYKPSQEPILTMWNAKKDVINLK